MDIMNFFISLSLPGQILVSVFVLTLVAALVVHTIRMVYEFKFLNKFGVTWDEYKMNCVRKCRSKDETRR